MTLSAKASMPNKYPGSCRLCGSRVPALGGMAVKTDGGWKVEHKGACTVQPVSTAIEFAPTAEQTICVDLFASGKDLVIQAGAGTGKSSTLRLLAQQALAAGRKGQYTAFNRSIVDDMAARLPGNVNASTMHSLAFQAVGAKYKGRMDASKRQRPDEIAAILGVSPFFVDFGDGGTKELPAGFLASRVLGAVKRFCQSADPEVTVRHFERIEGLDLPTEDGRPTYASNDAVARYLMPFARKAWADLTSETGSLRFTHDVYVKIWAMGDPHISGVDFLLVDEAQDVDPVQFQIIANQRKFGTQIVVCGDDAQSIYGWRGAVNALASFEETGANLAFLSQSFRFGDAIADQANGLLARLGARLRLRSFGEMASVVGPVSEPTAILTRTNAGAIGALLSELAKGRRTFLVGGGNDVVWFCEAALDLQAGKHTNHPELACFDSWIAIETYVADDESGSDLKLMVRIINDFGAQVIIDAIKHQPAEEKNADVVISTAHKAKGREWASVLIAGDFKAPAEGDLSAEELRLAYVAVTRAKRHLDLTNVPHFQAGWTPDGGDGGIAPGGDDPEGDGDDDALAKILPFPAPTVAPLPVPAKSAAIPAPVPAVASRPNVGTPDGPLHTVTLRGVTYYSRFLGKCDQCGTPARFEIPSTAPLIGRWVMQPPAHSCAACGQPVVVKAVCGKLTEGRCDPRCWNAFGSDCHCSCGGQWHGNGIGPTPGMADRKDEV